MNGASIFMILVLVAALMVGAGWMVGELNRNAEEILANRQTIQDLQAQLEQAHLAAASQQQTINDLQAALDQTSAELERARQALQAAQAGQDDLRQALANEQTARADAERQAAGLTGQVQILQARVAEFTAQMDHLYAEKTQLEQQVSTSCNVQPQIPVTGSATPLSSSLPLVAFSAAGLSLAGGGIAWHKRTRQ